jgi:hypothetical protein
MFEFRVVELRAADEFTSDNGSSWWKVRSTKRVPGGIDVYCECMQGQSGVGLSEWFLFLPGDKVIVR